MDKLLAFVISHIRKALRRMCHVSLAWYRSIYVFDKIQTFNGYHTKRIVVVLKIEMWSNIEYLQVTVELMKHDIHNYPITPNNKILNCN